METLENMTHHQVYDRSSRNCVMLHDMNGLGPIPVLQVPNATDMHYASVWNNTANLQAHIDQLNKKIFDVILSSENFKNWNINWQHIIGFHVFCYSFEDFERTFARPHFLKERVQQIMTEPDLDKGLLELGIQYCRFMMEEFKDDVELVKLIRQHGRILCEHLARY